MKAARNLTQISDGFDTADGFEKDCCPVDFQQVRT